MSVRGPKYSKIQVLTGSLPRYGKNRCVPQARRRAGLLGSAPGGGRPADAAHARGSHADQVSRPGGGGTRELHHGGIDPVAAEAPARGKRPRFLLCVGGRRPVSRQRVSQGDGHGRGLSLHSHADAEHGTALAASHRAQALRLPSGNDSGHRVDRDRQDHHPRIDDRLSEFDARAQHHQPGGPDRIRPPQQVEPGHPTRIRDACPIVRGRACARRCARIRT